MALTRSLLHSFDWRSSCGRDRLCGVVRGVLGSQEQLLRSRGPAGVPLQQILLVEEVEAVMEGFEILFDPKGWIVLLVLVVLGSAGVWVYHQFTEPTVYRLEMVKPGCKDYTTVPLMKCEDGTEQRRFLKCKCLTQWVEVTDEAERQRAIDKKPAGYKVEW